MVGTRERGLVSHDDGPVRIQPANRVEQRPAIHPMEAALLSLQRMAGNAAIGDLFDSARRQAADPSVQRCGPTPCQCSPTETLQADDAGRIAARDGEQPQFNQRPVQRMVVDPVITMLSSRFSTAVLHVQTCPQGKQKKVVHDDCGDSGPADPTNFIRHLKVSIAAQTVSATWGPRGAGTPSTRTDVWECSPRPGATPLGRDVVGVKCSINHTNMKRDGMAWFTGFASTGLRIGFHDSQRVGSGIFSHGCVRVLCGSAATINANTWSGVTTINVV
jgi:hypothetical protein